MTLKRPSYNLGRLSIGLIEHFTQPLVGEKFLNEVRQPSIEVELRTSLQKALHYAEERFIKEFQNHSLAEALLNLPLSDLPSVNAAVRDFYDRPNDSSLAILLKNQLRRNFGTLSDMELTDAVQTFIYMLRAELINVNPDTREKIAAQVLLEIGLRLSMLPIALGTDTHYYSELLPPLPDLRTFVGREQAIEEIKVRIGVIDPNKVNPVTIVRGWPGVGKTTLTSVLAHQSEVQNYFHDGIFWTSLGDKPNIMSELSSWARALGIADLGASQTVDEAVARLNIAFGDKKVLLIIDDIYEMPHAALFRQIGGKNAVKLFTTRFRDVATQLSVVPDQDIYLLPQLLDEQALDLLSLLAPGVVKDQPVESLELVQDLEGLPLAIQVAGRLLFQEAQSGLSIIKLLGDLRSTTKLLEQVPPGNRIDVAEQTNLTIAALLMKSTDRLDKEARLKFAFLGAFAPKPATFDIAAMKDVWQVEDPTPTVRELVARGLLEYIPRDDRYQMHSLLVMHANYLLEQDE